MKTSSSSSPRAFSARQRVFYKGYLTEFYTDGSQEIGKSGDPLGAGAGWTINEVGNWYSTQGVPLGDTQDVYDADVTAMLGGLNAALKSPLARVSLGLYICLDNLSVARNAGLTPKGSSQEIFRQFREAAKGWLQGGKGLSVQWIPGHMNIEGNEIADKEVRKYAKTPPNIQTRRTQSLSSAKRQLKSRKDKAWQHEWQTTISSGSGKLYGDLGLKPTTQAKISSRTWPQKRSFVMAHSS